MRNRLMVVTAALLLASVTVARAQEQKKTTTAPATEESMSLGTVDLGVRFGSVDGDRARFERYRDLRTGANVNLDLGKTTDTYTFGLEGSNLGYRDMNAGAFFANRKMKAEATFDLLPINYGFDGMTKTPWVESSAGVWTLDLAARQAVEAKTAIGVLCAPGAAAGATCNATTAAGVIGQASIYRGLAKDFDITARRDTMGLGVEYALTKDIDFDVTFKTTKREGYQPFGMAFSFNNANELPMHIDNRTNDIGFGLEWGTDKGSVRLNYERSAFNQNIASITWDNPIRATDWNDGQPIDATGNGPWDPSAYSNGNGPARGRMAMAPSNTFDLFSATGAAKLPGHSVVNAVISLGVGKQNDALIPWTINPVIATAATYAQYPGLAALPRATAQAQMDVINAVLNFTSRPAPWAAFSARYRYNDRKDRMPEFDGGNTVRFDGVPEPGPYKTEALDATRTSFNMDATFTPISYTAIKLGAGKERYEHSARGFGWLEDSIVRASIDSTGNQYVQLRAMIDRSRRVGGGFNDEAITGPGGQELSRMYEDAERTRDRATVILTVNPTSFIGITGSYAMGKDEYDEPEAYFGLLDNKNTATNVGFNVSPNDTVSFGANYGQDKFHAFQRSRTANPFTGVAGAYESWTDKNRDWTIDDDETVNNLDAFLDITLAKADIHFGYSKSDSDHGFTYGGPRIQALKTATILTPGDSAPCAAGLTSCFEALPNVTNTWQRLTADVTVKVSKKVGLGASLWYEKLEISDWNTVNIPGTDTPRIDYLGSLTTGYGNRPYKGTTGFLRLMYYF